MKHCKNCKWWRIFVDYVRKPRWFFKECHLSLHNRNPICLSQNKELYERKWWKLWIPKVPLLALALLIAGCMNYNSEKTAYRPDGSIESKTKASMTQCGVDSSRTDFMVEVEGLGKASVGASMIDAESFAEIIKALPEGLKEQVLILLGVKP